MKPNSRWEAWVLLRVCDPIARRLPASLSPNTLTLVNHALCWLCLGVAAAAPELAPLEALGARLLAAGLVAVSLILDCLDGIHARRTGQTSHLGEVLDHGLDALNTGLFGAAAMLTLSADPWTVVAAMALAPLPYAAQLILWHRTQRFLCSPTSGVEASTLLSLAFVGIGFFFFRFPPETYPAVGAWFARAFAAGCVITGFHEVAWFVRLDRGVLRPVVSVGLYVLLFGMLLPLGAMTGPGAPLLMGAVFFRAVGPTVLFTVLGRPTPAFDKTCLVWVPVLLAVHALNLNVTVLSLPLSQTLPFLASIHICGAAVIECWRRLPVLRALDNRALVDE